MFINHCITLIYTYYKVIHIMINHFNYREDGCTEPAAAGIVADILLLFLKIYKVI